ncbi:tripartite tricarboxylate transporter TctB family protein [Maritimibacter sp. 55A14]|uniref:tripartite tricarboxylate transporter TctB family protein n=1 Tax=Maritimibacter sp. 55A14 TaxID=2174844 RepID=UPI000D6171B6|nr:tripartite tricarboxylate transporter TctB family protein [Maritimibacter sp. 55A14]PWE33042.1 tripartite tricarboxylate transporter TctB family protein [Maritimibacter sp. 55A14]
MTVRTAELLMAIATFLASLGLMLNVYVSDLNIGWVEGRGPGAGMWPFWLAFVMALASFATLVRWIRGITPESRSTEDYVDRDTLFLVVISAVALLVLLILFEIIGAYFSLMLFMFFYLRTIGRHGWVATWSLVIGTPIFVYLLFEVALTKYLPKGLPFFENLFLYVDDIRYSLF